MSSDFGFTTSDGLSADMNKIFTFAFWTFLACVGLMMSAYGQYGSRGYGGGIFSALIFLFVFIIIFRLLFNSNLLTPSPTPATTPAPGRTYR